MGSEAWLSGGLWGVPCWWAVAWPMNSTAGSLAQPPEPPTVADKQMERLPEIQRKGPGHPGLPDRKLLLL